MCPVLGGGAIEDCIAQPETAELYIPDSTKRLPVMVSVIGGGPDKLECSRGGPDFRNTRRLCSLEAVLDQHLDCMEQCRQRARKF